MRNIIGFAGRKRSGKTLLSKFLANEYNGVVITIADYLKYLCCEILNIPYGKLIEWKDNGYILDTTPDERWFKLISNKASIDYNKVKEELEGKKIINVRQMLQVIGTDVIRKYNENWHVDQMVKAIETYSDDKLIVIDDVRFPNEKQAIERLGGKVFFIINTFNKEVSNHISEVSLSWRDFPKEQVILNTKKNEELFTILFKAHFANNFNIFIPDSIFLNENEKYLEEVKNTKNPLIIEDLKRFEP